MLIDDVMTHLRNISNMCEADECLFSRLQFHVVRVDPFNIYQNIVLTVLCGIVVFI